MLCFQRVVVRDSSHRKVSACLGLASQEQSLGLRWGPRSPEGDSSGASVSRPGSFPLGRATSGTCARGPLEGWGSPGHAVFGCGPLPGPEARPFLFPERGQLCTHAKQLEGGEQGLPAQSRKHHAPTVSALSQAQCQQARRQACGIRTVITSFQRKKLRHRVGRQAVQVLAAGGRAMAQCWLPVDAGEGGACAHSAHRAPGCQINPPEAPVSPLLCSGGLAALLPGEGLVKE